MMRGEKGKCNFLFAYSYIIKISASRKDCREIGPAQVENSNRVEQHDNIQLYFPWDEEVQG